MPITREDLIAEAQEMKRRVDATYGPAERWVPQSNAASLAAHPCAFYLWAIRSRPADLPDPWEGLPRIFEEGKLSEIRVRRKLEDAGYEITHDQMRFRDEDLDITGLIDGYIRREGSPVCHSRVPYETKGYSDNNFRDATSFERMLNASYYRLRLAPGQLLLYAYMAPEDRPIVCFVPRNKNTGEIAPFFEVVDEWFHILEAIGETVAKVNYGLLTGTPPEAIKYNPTWCDRCDAAAICPTMKVLRGGGDIRTVVDAELDQMCGRYLALKADRNEYNAVERQIKKYAEGAQMYDLEVGQMKTIVTGTHRVTVERKPRGNFTTILPLESDVEGDDASPDVE